MKERIILERTKKINKPLEFLTNFYKEENCIEYLEFLEINSKFNWIKIDHKFLETHNVV